MVTAGKPLASHFQQSNVAQLVVTDEFCGILCAVVGGHGQRLGIFYHMVVGQDIAVFRQDESGAGTSKLLLSPAVAGHALVSDGDHRVYILGIYLLGGKLRPRWTPG